MYSLPAHLDRLRCWLIRVYSMQQQLLDDRMCRRWETSYPRLNPFGNASQRIDCHSFRENSQGNEILSGGASGEK
jgi:hypothetical protein